MRRARKKIDFKNVISLLEYIPKLKLAVSLIISTVIVVFEAIIAVLIIPIIFYYSGISSSEMISLGDHFPLLDNVDSRNAFFIIIVCLRSIFKFTQEYIKGNIVENTRKILLLEVSEKYSKTKADRLGRYSTGRLTSLVTHDVERTLLSIQSISVLISSLTAAILLLLIVFLLNLKFASVFLLLSVISSFSYSFILKKTHKRAVQLTEYSEGYQERFSDFIRFLEYWKITGSMVLALSKLSGAVIKYTSNRLRIVKLNAFVVSIKEAIGILVLIGSVIIDQRLFGDNISNGGLSVQVVLLYRTSNFANIAMVNLGVLSSTLPAFKNYLSIVSDFGTSYTLGSRLIKNWDELSVSVDVKHVDSNFHLSVAELSFKSKGLYVIYGESGVGKSTLLKAISGRMDNAELKFKHEGKDLGSGLPSAGYLSQNPMMIKGSVQDNIVLDSKEVNSLKVRELLRFVGLSNRLEALNEELNSLNTNLSGGQIQRLALARELYRNVDLLLLDEPTSGLDVQNENEIILLLQTISKSKCVVVVTHSPDLIEASDYLIQMPF